MPGLIQLKSKLVLMMYDERREVEKQQVEWGAAPQWLRHSFHPIFLPFLHETTSVQSQIHGFPVELHHVRPCLRKWQSARIRR